MAIPTHPEYEAEKTDWVLMRDAYKGERQVKSKGELYLPATSGQIEDGARRGQQAIGYLAYQAYLKRARFHNFVRESVQTAIGMMHSQDSSIKLPAGMEFIRESLPILLRKINAEQLITGRVGVMADLPERGGQPYLTLYSAELIVNWSLNADGDLIMVSLDESAPVINEDYSWSDQVAYRVLRLNGDYEQASLVGNEDVDKATWIKPAIKGRVLQELPFVIINSCDVDPEVDDPPLLDLGNMCMTIYRSDADYRQNLFMQGQDTLVTAGGNFDETDKIRTGAGTRIDLPLQGKAEYIGVSANGLSEQREALARLEARAGTMGAQTLDSTSRERESGDSLRIRVAARTADMNQIAKAGAEGLQKILRIVARWMGANPEEVVVEPNLEFGEMPLTGQTMVEMTTARNQGFPISAKTLHDKAKNRRLTKLTFEEEEAQARKETGEDYPFKVRMAEQPERVSGNDTNPSGRQRR